MAHVFKQEQEEYQREGVPWTSVRFRDNQEVLDLLAVKACNLLSLIDEESHFPKVAFLFHTSGNLNTMLLLLGITGRVRGPRRAPTPACC